MSKFENMLQMIGNTPVVKLNHVVPDSPHTFWAKIEYFNPGNSVKDRIAIAIVEEAEKRGELKPGGTIIEATSGNTGLGLALVAAVKGYKSIFVMPDKISEEKRAILRAFGAKVVITPTALEPDDPGSFYSVAKKLVEITPNSFCANQYHNQDNPTQHYRTTGPEIWEQMEGQIDVFVNGAGTGGTISGVGKYLKEQNPNCKIVCADPIGSILYDLFYYKEVKEPPKPYKVEGVGEDMLPTTLHMDVVDDFVQVGDKAAFDMTRDLIAREGLCVGPSSGLSLCGAIEYSKKLDKPSNILVMFPDNGRAYMSKAYNEEWLKENDLLPSTLKETQVRDLLKKCTNISQMISVDVSSSVKDVVVKMKETGISQFPVSSDGAIVGFVDEQDLLESLSANKIKSQEPVIHLAKGNVIWVDPQDDLSHLKTFLLNGYVALVKESDTVKVVTKIDMLEYLSNEL